MTVAAAATIITATTMVPQRMMCPRKQTDFILI
jgi:hypothetical protein